MTVVFDYAAWIARYPEFAVTALAPAAQQFFNEAQLYCDNTSSSPITDDSVGGQRAMILGMLTAHIAYMAIGVTTGASGSQLVGRINNASEGSVSVQTENLYPPGSAQWFQQTRYGSAAWAAMAAFRTFRYFGKPRARRW
jgi:hypothetical protein